MVRLVVLDGEGASAIKIASVLEANPTTVVSALRRIHTEAWICRRYLKRCSGCRREFFAQGHHAVVCSEGCKRKVDAQRHQLRRQLDNRAAAAQKLKSESRSAQQTN